MGPLFVSCYFMPWLFVFLLHCDVEDKMLHLVFLVLLWKQWEQNGWNSFYLYTFSWGIHWGFFLKWMPWTILLVLNSSWRDTQQRNEISAYNGNTFSKSQLWCELCASLINCFSSRREKKVAMTLGSNCVLQGIHTLSRQQLSYI